jgi:hypothetical protein
MEPKSSSAPSNGPGADDDADNDVGDNVERWLRPPVQAPFYIGHVGSLGRPRCRRRDPSTPCDTNVSCEACLDGQRITASEIRYGVADYGRLCGTCVFISSILHLSHRASRIGPPIPPLPQTEEPTSLSQRVHPLSWIGDPNAQPFGFTAWFNPSTVDKPALMDDIGFSWAL